MCTNFLSEARIAQLIAVTFNRFVLDYLPKVQVQVVQCAFPSVVLVKTSTNVPDQFHNNKQIADTVDNNCAVKISYATVTKMCITSLDSQKCKMLNRSTLGRAVRAVLAQARGEDRLICGLLPAISHLEEDPGAVLLCLMPLTPSGDAGNHMQSVLLQAFCYENDIPVLQVDSEEKLAELCGLSPRNGGCQCAIVTLPAEQNWGSCESIALSPVEQSLTDFYDCTLEEFPRPVIQLPPVS